MKIESVIMYEHFKEFKVEIQVENPQDLEDLNHLIWIVQSANFAGLSVVRKNRIGGIIDRLGVVIEEAKS